jgi:membrane protein implicated in regulation of membrane protease activity
VDSLSVSDITRILQIAGVLIAVLTVLLVISRIAIWILRHLFRKTMSADNMDLIGQQAIVRKTVRSQRPGEIECEWRGQLLNGKALSDETVRPGREVLIYAVQGDYFKVRPLEYNFISGRYDDQSKNVER